MKELENITFVIPLRVDSEERRTNLDAAIDYLCLYPDIKIIVLEADTECRYKPRIEHPCLTCHYIEDHDPIFHRTRYINLLLRSVKTPVAGVWDSDVIVPLEQIAESVRRCMTDDILCYPYDGRFFFMNPNLSLLYKETRDFDILVKNESRHLIYNGLYSVGGAFTVNVEKYLSKGGENEYFYGWGPEDTERRERINNLSLNVSRVAGCLYHLHHPRFNNSKYANLECELTNRREYVKVCRMNRRELEEYISNWPWFYIRYDLSNISQVSEFVRRIPTDLNSKKNIKHAFLVLAHNNVNHILKLLKCLDDDFSVYIHFDKKYRLSVSEKETLSSNKKVKFVSQKFAINWGSINIVIAELYLMESALRDEDIDYIHLISGQDYLVKNLSDFKLFFKQNNGSEFIDIEPLPRKEWDNGTFARYQYYRPFNMFDYRTETDRKIINFIFKLQLKLKFKRKIPNYFKQMYGGSNWCSLTKRCAKYLLEFTEKNPAFLRQLKCTLAPDETYFNTIVANSPFKNSVIKNNLRFISWLKIINGSPLTLDERFFLMIKDSNCCFARKFEYPYSQNLVSLIDKYILRLQIDKEQKDIFEIQDDGIWINNTLQRHCYDYPLGLVLCDVFKSLKIKDIVDLGCGPGWYVKTLRESGFDATGYDGNPYTEEISEKILGDGTKCSQQNLTEKFLLWKKVDLIMSLEVGEHIPMQFEDIFIDNLTNNAQSYILLSWATGKFKGDGHVNCRTNEYVVQKMLKRGFIENTSIKNILRKNSSLEWFKDTILFFQKM